MTFDEILERVTWSVKRSSALSVEQVRVIAEAAFPQINNQVSQEYAAKEDNRAILRKNVSLTFVGGSIGIPQNVLRKYLKDSTLVLSTGEIAAFIEPYADFLRVRDGRLAWWSFSNLLVSARNSAANGGGAYAGAATLTCIASPEIPATASTVFAAPDDYNPDLIDALITFVAGRSADAAAQETVE